ncbi:MAG TPA: hypothetical protein EYP05_05540 [Piscirickettsiaceae bacterium]|nr:hypothetical protein [Piscirickettsiaceae bacterium]HIQ39749.1 hypothetical protein [Sulfurivirga caldicuralii]
MACNDKHQYKFGHGSDAAHRQDQALFQQLLENHWKLNRKTAILPNGIRAITRSTDAALVKVLQEHVAGMKARFEGGRAIRSWDPLFAALFEFRHQIQFHYENEPDGVIAELTSEDAKIVELIIAHDETLHHFIRAGYNISGEPAPAPQWVLEHYNENDR